MQYCFGWGWYLAVDFQLFLITPFVLYLYSKNKTLGWILTIMLFLASVVTAFVMIMVNNWRYPIFNPFLAPQPDFMDKFYYKPYIRASAYFMGIASAYFYTEWKNNNEFVVDLVSKIKNSIPIRICFYVVGIILVEGTIWIIVPFQTGSSMWSTVAQAFYNSLNRVFFLIGMYLCIFAAMFGCKNDPAHIFLSNSFFSPLAKVSFCVYLTHFIVIMNGTFSSKMDLFWQPTTSLYLVISDIFWSVLLATVLSVLVESPILGLERVFLRPSRAPKNKENPKIEFQDDQIKAKLLNQGDIEIQDKVKVKNKEKNGELESLL